MQREPAVALFMAFLALVLLIAGCATSSDPGDGGFVNGIVGIWGGRYQSRMDEKQAALDERLREVERLEDEATRVRAERERLGDVVLELQQRLNQIEREVDEQRRRLAREERMTYEARRDLRRAEEQLALARGSVPDTSDGGESIPALEQAADRLRREVDHAEEILGLLYGL